MEISGIHVCFLIFCGILNIPTLFCLPETHTALFVFGDSLFDAGNNNYINTIPSLRANYPPYGENFFKYSSGRFSDGRVIPDFIAEYAGLPLIPPYLHPDYHQLYVYGVNFASAGAGVLVETRQGQVINLQSQVNGFKKVYKQFRQNLGQAKVNELLSRSVYIFSVGGNDYATFSATNSSIPYTNQEYVDIVIGNLTAVIKELYKVGGRKFGFVNVGPLSCFPFFRILGNGSLDSCKEDQVSILARIHNSGLTNVLGKLDKELKGFKYSILDVYNQLLQLMKYPSKYGFKEGDVACCGGGPYRGDNSCGGQRGIEEYELCENASEYVFFDSAHPTDEASKHFAQLFWSRDKDTTKPYNLKSLFNVKRTVTI